MVVAMVVMGMVKVVTNQIVDVIAVGHRLVPTASSVLVVGRVPFAGMADATRGIAFAHVEHVFVDVILMGMVEVPVVDVVDVAVMLDCGVAATWSVLVLVRLVDRMFAHWLRVDQPPTKSKHLRVRSILSGLRERVRAG